MRETSFDRKTSLSHKHIFIGSSFLCYGFTLLLLMAIVGPIDSHRMESSHIGQNPSRHCSASQGHTVTYVGCVGIHNPKGANPQRVSTEIIIEMKQLYSGRIASNPFIASYRRYMVFPRRDHFFIENGPLD